jgi:hypothetical protein
MCCGKRATAGGKGPRKLCETTIAPFPDISNQHATSVDCCRAAGQLLTGHCKACCRLRFGGPPIGKIIGDPKTAFIRICCSRERHPASESMPPDRPPTVW